MGGWAGFRLVLNFGRRTHAVFQGACFSYQSIRFFQESNLIRSFRGRSRLRADEIFRTLREIVKGVTPAISPGGSVQIWSGALAELSKAPVCGFTCACSISWTHSDIATPPDVDTP